ncbi:unnamed protein product [Cylindrotheca closterium]|uniref:Uncharacterized protein n=1 Tax=Cylindrotheca closterium TaxID=2856 RepID=A0AAD2JLS0_9STRA|nr:unnamed protein product [Cylindrotheca closterium]
MSTTTNSGVEFVTPLPKTELNEATAAMFHELIAAASQIPGHANNNTEEEVQRACEEFNVRLIQALTENPVLARVVGSSDSLLFIMAYVLWVAALKISPPLHIIAGHDCHYQLMCWIAETHPWVLDHTTTAVANRRPPVFDFLGQYTAANSNCSASTVRRFFQAYPKGLAQKNSPRYHGYTALASILGGATECNADLFRWMAEQHPRGMTYKTMGYSVLGLVCAGLQEFSHYGNDSVEIIQYLIQTCPKLVSQKSLHQGNLPIHALVKKCNRLEVQNAVILLLKAFPESYNMPSELNGKAPSEYPFIEQIMPLIAKEMELTGSISLLKDLSMNFYKAISDVSSSNNNNNNNNPLLHKVANVLDSWCKDCVTIIEVDQLQGLPAQILAVQYRYDFVGSDVESSSDEEEQAIF